VGGAPHEAKSFDIPKALVWEAYEHVKANGGAAGSITRRSKSSKNAWATSCTSFGIGCAPAAISAAGQSCSDSEEDRRRSGVGRSDGGGSCGADGRQAVAGAAARSLFHTDSYGYRPGRSAHDAIAVTKRRCWEYDWVIEFDIKGLLDAVS